MDYFFQTFFKKFRPDAVGEGFTTVLVNGGLDDQSQPGVEANLDIQYTQGISYPTPNIFYSTGSDSQPNEFDLDFLNFILNQTTIPQTFTISYGGDEQVNPFPQGSGYLVDISSTDRP